MAENTATPAAPSPTPSASPSPSTSSPVRSTPSSAAASSTPSGVTAREFRQQMLRGNTYNQPQEEVAEVEETVDTSSPYASQEGIDDSGEEDIGQDEPVAEEEDLEWLQGLKDYKELHGMPIQELLAALSQGQLPEALWDKLRIKLKDGDTEWEDTILGARNGAQMRKKLTQKSMEFAKERDAFLGEKNEFVGLLQGWTNPEQLLEGMQELGFPFMEAAIILAKQEEHLDKLEAAAPGSRALHEAKRAAELESKKLKREMAKLQQGQQQKTETSSYAEQVETVKKAAPSAFEQGGLRMTEGSWNAFSRHFTAVWNAHGGEPTAEMLRYAVAAAKEEVEADVAAHKAGKAPAPKPVVSKAVVGRAVDPGKPTQQRPAGNKGLTHSQFRAQLMGKR